MHGKGILSALVCILLCQVCLAFEDEMLLDGRTEPCKDAVIAAQKSITKSATNIATFADALKMSYNASMHTCRGDKDYNRCIKGLLLAIIQRIKLNLVDIQGFYEDIQAKLASGVKNCS